MKQHLFVIAFVLLSNLGWGQESIDLSGRWGFRIDREDKGVNEQWYNRTAEEYINLPGSMPEKGKGDDVSVHTQWTGSLYDSSYYVNPRMAVYRQPGNMKLPFFLTPDKHYVGVAWYTKEVTIPAGWRNRHIELLLERPHIETTLWVDGKEAGRQYSLSVPHVYDLTPLLSPGKHRIAIRIDNRIKEEYFVGPDSHSITDQTQGNWNGIVGKIALQSTPKTYFSDIQIYPDVKGKQARVKMQVESDRKTTATLTLSAGNFNNVHKQDSVPAHAKKVTLEKGSNTLEMTLSFGEGLLLWDESEPNLYRLNARLQSGKDTDSRQVEFGMRDFTIEGKYFFVNGNKTMLRGTVENCDFPLTGYAPMDVESWERVFRICRNYGLNHMRFHSFCPPEAAFKAADRVGFYLQPEGPSWPNHGSSLGYGKPIDTYLMEETQRLTKAYGNYASYCMLACGNEPRGRWVKWVSDFVDYWKKTDSRRVYTGASVGGSWQWQPHNEYHVKAGARGLDWGRRPQSTDDYRSKIDTVGQPYVSHETGQWCAFPNFNEIRKYTGVNKAKNFEIFRDLLNEAGLGELGHDFTMASGKLQALCYKYEIERTLRTPDYAGFQLLALNDYSGQGTALVGLLDVFFEEKGYIDAASFRRFCNTTVPLARIPKFVYTNDETFRADIEIAHFGRQPIPRADINYRITNHLGAEVASDKVSTRDIALGNCQAAGSVEFPLSNVLQPEKMNLEVSIAGTDFTNDWDFWVYPAKVDIRPGDVYVTRELDAKAEEVLKEGGKVLVLAAGKISYGKEIVQYFTPVFWNTSWFKMRPPHTTGIFLNEYHPLFKNFPTEYHSNLQWWELLHRAQVMRLSDFPIGFQPVVYSIDTWFLSRKAGMLFEANVLNGKLLMTSMDLTSDPDKRIVARQLYKSVLDYMQSDTFRPAQSLEPEQIRELYTKEAPAIDFGTVATPDELRPKATDI